jgi:hypothetical protein
MGQFSCAAHHGMYDQTALILRERGRQVFLPLEDACIECYGLEERTFHCDVCNTDQQFFTNKNTLKLCPHCINLSYNEYLQNFSPVTSIIHDDRTHQQREEAKQFRNDLLQPRREGEPSKEFIEAFPERSKSMFTDEERRKAKYVWKGIDE